MQDIRFNKTTLDRLPPAAPGCRDTYCDVDGGGLQLRVTERSVKTFLVRKKIGNKSVRVTLGRYPEMTIEQARRQAAREMSKLVDGLNPNSVRREEEKRSITLSDVLDDYVAARKSLKKSTADDYRKRLRELFPDWQNRAIATITRNMVAQRHSTIGARSPSQANKGMRILRALFNFAAGAYEDAQGKPIILDNPVKRLSHTRAWYRVERRRTIIEPHQLEAWFKAVLNLKPVYPGESSETVRDYLIFLLLTGLRREEAASLTWQQVDLKSRKITVTDTKNSDPHALPMTDYLFALLTRRKELTGESSFVFASDESKRGYLHNPYKQMKRVIAESEVPFTLHDLRRTFTTTAESLDISPYTIKRLINHRLPADVTAGYIVIHIDRLRKPLEDINAYILKAAGQVKAAPRSRSEQPAGLRRKGSSQQGGVGVQ